MYQDSFLNNSSDASFETILDHEHAKVIYTANFLANHQDYFNILKNELEWQQDMITVYGKQHKTPRLTAWYGDNQLQYSYSGLTLTAKPWHSSLLLLKKIIEVRIDSSFNAVLANYYRDGQDSMGWHADDETELGERPVIASLSLGGERRFSLKHRFDKTMKPLHIPLAAGSLLVMSGNTQKYYLHQVAKTQKTVDPRINLTFRRIYHD